MSTPIALFDYELPQEYIAQAPMEPRDHSKLMVLDRSHASIEHKKFFDLVDYLRPGDVLVFNNTKVFKARLLGRIKKEKMGERENDGEEGKVEIFLLRERDGLWEVLMRPGKKVSVGSVIDVGTMHALCMHATVKEKHEDGTVLVDFGVSTDAVLAFCEAHGEVPIPPYVEKSEATTQNYQTVYAKETGAVAAPTAGLHFTEALLEKIKAKGVQIEFVTLHVGLGTFLPVKSATLEEHMMHAEFVRVDEATAERINLAKSEGRRVIAVGTTTVRTLEAVADLHLSATSLLSPYTGDVNIFITPGYAFKIVDAMITNFHLPKSTLLALVSAFAGREFVLQAYEEAKKNDYRFYSFGDAMFLF